MNDTLPERLKRSALAQAVVVFLGAAWVVLQVVDLLQERLGLPDWVFPLTIILLAVGFVVVLATAVVQSRASTTEAEEAGQVPSDWEVAPAQALASLKAGKLPHLTWGRAVVGGVVSLSLLLGAAGAFVLLTGGGPGLGLGPAEVGANEAATAIAILPFSSNSEELAHWEEGIVDLLTPGLDGVAGYRTIASRTVLSRWRESIGDGEADLDGALAVAGATGARYAVTGSVVGLGADIRLTAEVYDLADGSKVADGRAEGSAEDVLRLVDQLGVDAMRSLMGAVGGEGIDQALPGRITTTSLTAARAFLEGEGYYRAGRFEEALRSYREAMQADSTFGLPVLRAELSLGWVGNEEERDSVDRRLEGVLEYLPPRDRTLARLRLAIGGDSLRSARPAEEAVVRYPDDAEAWFMLGEVRAHEPGLAGGGHGPAREAFERAVRLAPDFVPYLYHPIEYAIGAGDQGRAEELIGRLEAAVPDDPRIESFRSALLLLFGDLEEARVFFRENFREALRDIQVRMVPARVPRVWALIQALPSSGEVGLTDLASTFALAAGRPSDALALMHRIPAGNSLRITLARHHQDLMGSLPDFDADAEYDLGKCGGVGSDLACREKVALHAVDRGRADEARRTVAYFDSLAADGGPPGRTLLLRRMARSVEGYLAWKEGEVDEALRSFQAARREDRFAVTVRWFLAEVLVDSGSPMAAVELYLSLDDSPTWSPFAHLRAAEVLEDMGDLSRSAALYRSALSAWVDAEEGFAAKTRAEEGLTRVAGG